MLITTTRQPEYPDSQSLRIDQTRLNNLIAGVEYEFGQRYFLSAFINYERHDYALSATYLSKVEPVNSTQWFPSSMIGWKIHNESFMRNLAFLSHMVLKAGYGITGSHTMPVTIRYFNDRQVSYPMDMEKTGELSLGLDLGLLNDRFRASAVYYTRETGNGLSSISLPVPPYPVGFGFGNNTLITNKGFELMLNAVIISHGKLQWNSGFNYFKNTNELVEWESGPDYKINTGYIQDLPGGFYANFTQQLGVGTPPLAFYLPEYAGISENGAYTFTTPTGRTSHIEFAPRSVIGQVVPAHELGWWNMLSFNNAFDFSFLIRYVGGHSIYNATRMYLAEPARFGANNVSNEAVDFLDEGLKTFLYVSDLFLEDASYLRLENITLGYRLQTGGEKHKISARLFFSVNNAFTISEFSGFDPAHDYSGVSNGIDYFNRYPLSRSFVFGLNISL
jgi:TonB-dependent starch-binding outer membrane protein SusC